MFDNQHYLTSGVAHAIPPPLQMFLWQCVHNLPEERDYLQVFRLESLGAMQRIRHSSEQPPHHREYLLLSDAPITAKVYVIDGGDYSTMLLADEY